MLECENVGENVLYVDDDVDAVLAPPTLPPVPCDCTPALGETYSFANPARLPPPPSEGEIGEGGTRLLGFQICGDEDEEGEYDEPPGPGGDGRNCGGALFIIIGAVVGGRGMPIPIPCGPGDGDAPRPLPEGPFRPDIRGPGDAEAVQSANFARLG